MSLTVAILLIVLGIILVLLDILVVPGMILGIIGICLSLVGVISVYINYGSFTGNIVLLGTVVASASAVYLTFRSNTWKKVSLNVSLDGKVNTFNTSQFKVGDIGTTLSRLAPSGKALINGVQLEVHSVEGYVNENTSIVITKLDESKIIVKSKS